MQLSSWFIPAVLFAAVNAALLGYGWRLRNRPGGWPFLAYVLSGLLWELGQLGQVGGAALLVNVGALGVKALAGIGLTVACFAFVATLTGRGTWVSRRSVSLLAAFPLVLTLLLVIRPELVLSHFELRVVDGIHELVFERGPVALVGIWYCYGLLALASGLVVDALVRAPSWHRRQAAPLLIGIVLPWLLHALQVSGLVRSPTLDPTTPGIAVASLAFLWALLHDYVLDLTPIARTAIFTSMSDGVVVLDRARRIVDLNPAAEQMLGRSLRDVLGVSGSSVLGAPVMDTMSPDGRQLARHELTLGEGDRRRDYELRVSLLLDPSERHVGWLIVLRDVTERKAMERQLRYQAFHDVLTGLVNRRMFLERLEAMTTSDEARRLAVLIVDLDGFKDVNDRLGHHAGDALLKAVARRLSHCTRAEDVVARFGGDEFAVLLWPVEREVDAQRVAERILLALGEPFSVDGTTALVGCSIGYALGFAGAQPDDLLRHADLALYAAKAAGKGCALAYSAVATPSIQ
jgi:diguanylate cyclase (GGDEF)-like protein/PAS domain S-box-containing protein